MGLEPLAEQGFRSRADVYERARPGWPDEAVERLAQTLAVTPDSTVVDLAAGTGKLTRELVGRAGRVIAVEPSRAMRDQLSAIVPEVELIDATADALPLPSGCADAVFVADAFHWFATREAVAEIARVLRRDGGLALLWHAHAPDAADPAWREFAELVASHRPDGGSPPSYESGAWRQPFAERGLFDPFQLVTVRQDQVVDLDGFLLHMSTWSFVAALDEGAREAVLAGARGLLERVFPDPGRIVIPYRVEGHWARRR